MAQVLLLNQSEGLQSKTATEATTVLAFMLPVTVHANNLRLYRRHCQRWLQDCSSEGGLANDGALFVFFSGRVHERGSSGPCGRCMKNTVFVTEYDDSNEDRCKGRFCKGC